MKYIVKNCPCYWHIGEDEGCDLDNMKACEYCTDCVIKQVIEKCKKHNNTYPVWEILNMFDIEEVK